MITLERMAKGKTQTGEREERKPVQLPLAWFALLRRLAAMNRQPHTWYFLSLVEAAAKDAGIEDIPPLPWETDEDLKAKK